MLRGIPRAAVHGELESDERAHYLAQFKRGDASAR
jgi:superfamily II DNA/RNA helicase